MKKKGFTLIELLAVIVILAIIALIATPIIIGVIDKARKGAFEDSAYGVLDAGRLYFIDKLADNNTFAGETFDFTKANNLKLSGEKPAGGTLVLDSSGRQALAIHDKDKRWCASKTYEEEKVTVGDYKEGECKAEGAGGGTASDSITDKNTEGNTDGLFTDDYGNIRYRGASPKNYVTFNNEAWRIIGIVDGKVKLIRDEKVKDLAWNTTNENEWIGSTVQGYLSGEYYNSLSNAAKSQIEEHTYKLGGIQTTSGVFSKDVYLLERGTSVYAGRSTEWTEKVGLAYVSDYGYAAGSGCTKDLINYSTMDACAKDDWLYKSSYHWWLMTPNSSSSSIVSLVHSMGLVGRSSLAKDVFGIHPVLHLKSSVKIAGGDGTQANPYTLS